MYFQYFQISFLCPRIKWRGGILLLSCLSGVNINIRYNFLAICDRDFILYAYFTNKALSNDSDIHSEINLFRTLLPFGEQCFRMCAEFAIFPKISNFAPFRFGSIAYIFNKIVNHHCINTNAYTKYVQFLAISAQNLSI